MQNKLVVIGAGGLATQLIDDLQQQYGPYLCFVDQVTQPPPQQFFGYLVCSTLQQVTDWYGPAPFPLIVAVGATVQRAALWHQWLQWGRPVSIISKQAIVSPHARISTMGCLLLSRCLVEAEASMEQGCLINAGAQIHHHVRLGEFATIGPGALLLGGCSIGRDTEVGAGAIILPGITVGDNCIIGAGALVTKDVPDGTTVVGMPAKPIHPTT